MTATENPTQDLSGIVGHRFIYTYYTYANGWQHACSKDTLCGARR